MGRVTFDYSEQTVIVTGASSGIGRQIALEFGDAGATVLNADIKPFPNTDGEGSPTHEVLREKGATAEYVETDVATYEDVLAAVDKAREHGGVDVMVNNAGITSRTSVLGATHEEFDNVMGINAGGVILECRAAAIDMIDRGEGGSIVNTASICSSHAIPSHVLYDASKGAVRMITRSGAFELASHDIRVNAVAPGIVATEISRGAETVNEMARRDEYVKSIPLSRAGQPSDVASAVLFLASDAASYITGELLFVDGGWQTY